ncbi:MAG: ABC transporter ATP-binding protein [Planctomycetes bacterium]|nr:ABC transporter ATP-binding protein [Planctomycetota bacterium]
MLVVEDLVVAYGAVVALHGVSLEAKQGEIVTLIGANGAGKSTTLRAVSGMVAPRRGSVRLDGREVGGVPAHRLVRRGLAHVPEGRRIFTGLSVRENLELGAYTVRGRAEVAARLERVLALFPRLAERIAQSGGTLSGGEQQMLAIGRAMMARPRLLLLDEPSLGLAPLLVREIFREIARINREEGTTILLVEQNAHLALSTAHRGYVLETGRVALADAAPALLESPRVRAAYLGAT